MSLTLTLSISSNAIPGHNGIVMLSNFTKFDGLTMRLFCPDDGGLSGYLVINDNDATARRR